MNVEIGALIAQRYRILDVLGQGGMSTVFLARDEHFPHVQRYCAIKVLRPSSDPTLARLQQAAFEREAALLATLRHPGIPQIYDFFVDHESCLLVLEYLDGEDLEHYLRRLGRPLQEAELIEYALQILDVLEYLHAQRPQPIVFRDLKPSNIIRRLDGRLSLIDFGIARLFQPQARATTIGTEGYAPPEQYRGMTDPRSDLYALGATLYHLATGIDPRDEPPFSIAERSLRSVNPDLSPEFEKIVLTALAYDPSQRFPSATAMAKALQRLRTRSLPTELPSGSNHEVAQSDAHQIIWRLSTNDEIRGSPTRFGTDLIVFGSYDGYLYAVNLWSGQLLWRFPTGRGIATTPLVVDELVVFGSDDGAIYCVHGAGGDLVWRYRTAGPVRSSPALAESLVFAGSDDGFLYALDLPSGTLVWRRQARRAVRATPVTIDDFVVAGSDDGVLYAWSIRDGRTLWQRTVSAPLWNRPLLMETMLVVATVGGAVVALEPDSGELLWQQTLPDAFVASPILWRSQLILAGNYGQVYAVHPGTGELLWALTLTSRIASTPVAADSELLIATENGSIVWCAPEGTITRTTEVGAPIVATPLLAADRLLVATLAGDVRALSLRTLTGGMIDARSSPRVERRSVPR